MKCASYTQAELGLLKEISILASGTTCMKAMWNRSGQASLAAAPIEVLSGLKKILKPKLMFIRKYKHL